MDNEMLVARIRAGEDVAGNMLALWQRNKGFIAKIAMKYQGRAELEDLKQEGYIGLCEAVRHYEPAANVPFINYAAFWIKQAMQRYIENCGGVVRIPAHAREWMSKYKKILREYRQYYGCEPSELELCHLLGVGLEKLHAIQESARMGQIKSLSDPIGGEEENPTVEDIIASDEDIEADVIKRLDTAAIKKELWIAVEQLPKEQAEIVRKRYQECMTLKELGEKLGTSREHIRQMEYKALKKLRMPNMSGKFRVYYEEYLAAGPVLHVGLESFSRTWTSAVEKEVLGL